jgi:hypothetical protein
MTCIDVYVLRCMCVVYDRVTQPKHRSYTKRIAMITTMEPLVSAWGGCTVSAAVCECCNDFIYFAHLYSFIFS